SRLDGLVIGVPRPWVERPLDPIVRAGFQQVLKRLDAAGAEVRELQAPFLDPPGLGDQAASGEIAVVHRRWMEEHPDRYGPEVRQRLHAALEVSHEDYVAALEWRTALRHASERLFAQADLLATPTVAALRKRIGDDLVDVDGHRTPYRSALSAFSALVNQMGNPALALPIRGDGAPPPSLQLIAPHWKEHRLLAVGLALEEADIVGFNPPPAW
ncbi:MAG: amidase family protein, partial [Acidimicrobiia bacterium]